MNLNLLGKHKQIKLYGLALSSIPLLCTFLFIFFDQHAYIEMRSNPVGFYLLHGAFGLWVIGFVLTTNITRHLDGESNEEIERNARKKIGLISMTSILFVMALMIVIVGPSFTQDVYPVLKK